MSWYKSKREVILQQEPKGLYLFIVIEENPENVNHFAIWLIPLKNYWFSHDVTKIQTLELLILLRFHSHDV